MSNVPYLRFGTLNACSIRNKIEETMLLIKSQDIDIMCVTESWLSAKDEALSREIQEHRYNLLSVARGSRGGASTVEG